MSDCTGMQSAIDLRETIRNLQEELKRVKTSACTAYRRGYSDFSERMRNRCGELQSENQTLNHRIATLEAQPPPNPYPRARRVSPHPTMDGQ